MQNLKEMEREEFQKAIEKYIEEWDNVHEGKELVDNLMNTVKGSFFGKLYQEIGKEIEYNIDIIAPKDNESAIEFAIRAAEILADLVVDAQDDSYISAPIAWEYRGCIVLFNGMVRETCI